jgi:hypothetical protein
MKARLNRRHFLTAASAGAVAGLAARPASALAVDYNAIGKIRTEGLGDTSKIMDTSSYLMDVLGPRLTASPGARASGEWVVSKLREYGCTSAALEPWPADPTGTNNGFPRGWRNTHFEMGVTAPVPFPVTGMSVGWTQGTNGLVSGECILVPETVEGEVKAKYAGQLRGKWVLGQNPPDLRAQWDPVARRLTREQLDNLETAARAPELGTPVPPRPQPTPPNRFNRNAWFKSEGALGVITTNKGQGVINVFGGQRDIAPEETLPTIAVIAEHYGRMARTVKQGVRVVLEADIRNEWTPNPPVFNVVGEIRGRTKPNETVIIGGHFDSFHAATGATDNGGNCATAMEAMRILLATNARPERTVRICLWTGEEQGLIGSRLYVSQHYGGVRGAPTAANPRGVIQPMTADHARFQAYFNLDNGCGAIRGIYNQSNNAMTPIFREWAEPFRDIGMTHVAARNTGSTDHVSFDQAGLPGFQFIQDPIDYEPKTHHTNMDFYESLQPEDMKRNSTILAGFALLAANHPERLPRKPYTPPPEPPPPVPPAPPARPAPT